jgi:hypothetical protein
MSTKQSAGVTTAPEVAAPANLAQARKEQAAAKQAARGTHPAGTKVPAQKAPPAKKAAGTERKTPTQSEKPKLRWDGEVANVTIDGKKVEVGRRVKQTDDTYDAVVLISGKATVLATGKSKHGAYQVVVDFYYRGTRPEAKKAVAS